MTPTDHVRRMFATIDAKDVSALAAFMTDDVRLRLGNAQPVQGKTAFVEAVNAFVASVAGFRHELLNIWSDGDAMIAEFDVHYTRLDGGEASWAAATGGRATGASDPWLVVVIGCAQCAPVAVSSASGRETSTSANNDPTTARHP
jgi:ketosteroid isomerase-like protein